MVLNVTDNWRKFKKFLYYKKYVCIIFFMKKYKINFFCFSIFFFFCINSYANLLKDKAFENLKAVLEDPYYNNLEIDKNFIQKKSLSFKDSFLLAKSYFLENNNFLTENQKITLEKINCLIGQKENFWFSNIFSYEDSFLQKWKFQKFEKKDSCILMRPYIKNGLFFNYKNESFDSMSVKEKISLFLKKSFRKYSEKEMKKFLQKDTVFSRSENLSIHWIGHSTFLIQVDGINILTDPVFDGFYPILKKNYYKRIISPGIELKDLAKVDVVLISHNHFDHMEKKALLHLKKYQPQILVGQGLKKYFLDLGFKNVEEHLWWDKTCAFLKDKKISFYFVPANHSSMKMKNMKEQSSLWGGWVIKTMNENMKVYFAGDTGFRKEVYEDIKKKFRDIDVALLPIAPFNAVEKHLDVKAAIEVLNILNAKMIPMHFLTYDIGKENIKAPLLLLQKKMQESKSLQEKIFILKIGQRIEFKDNL